MKRPVFFEVMLYTFESLYDLYPISGMILSSAMSPSAKVCDQAYDIPRLNKYFDFVSIMTYDYHGQWDKKTGHVRFL